MSSNCLKKFIYESELLHWWKSRTRSFSASQPQHHSKLLFQIDWKMSGCCLLLRWGGLKPDHWSCEALELLPLGLPTFLDFCNVSYCRPGFCCIAGLAKLHSCPCESFLATSLQEDLVAALQGPGPLHKEHVSCGHCSSPASQIPLILWEHMHSLIVAVSMN